VHSLSAGLGQDDLPAFVDPSPADSGTQRTITGGVVGRLRDGRGEAGDDAEVQTDENRPVELAAAFASFDQLWSPRILTKVNDYDVRIAKVAGEHVWHIHDYTDEFFLVIAGELRIAMRGPGAATPDDDGGERIVVLPRGSVFVVPRGVEHRPSSPSGASILMFEPSGTSSVGDRPADIPDHIDATIGHPLNV
jgi:mannose-6-phosphate isomerase-like protein (cupin superfamily)